MGKTGSRVPTFKRTAGRDKVFAWLSDVELQAKIPQATYMENFGLTEVSWRFFESQWEKEQLRDVEKAKLTRSLNRERKKRAINAPVEPLDEDDPVGWWQRNGRSIRLNQAIFESATEKLNPNSMKLAKQLAGELVEKKEVTFGLQPDDYYRIRAEAQRRIQESLGNPDGDRSLLPQPTILLDEVCLDNK